SGINGRHYWKDSSLDNRYCNWYSCDWLNRYFLLWVIFRIRFIPVVITQSVGTQRDSLLSLPSNQTKKVPVGFFARKGSSFI
ncbi:hypothetical protein M569_00483, partial [Genlisea aurea]